MLMGPTNFNDSCTTFYRGLNFDLFKLSSNPSDDFQKSNFRFTTCSENLNYLNSVLFQSVLIEKPTFIFTFLISLSL